MVFLFNPGKKRGRARKGKSRRKGTTYRRRKSARRGTSAYRKAVRRFACSKHPIRTIAALRRRGGCSKRVPQLTVRASRRSTRGLAALHARAARKESSWARLWGKARSNPGISLQTAGQGFMPAKIMDVAPVALGIFLNKTATVWVSKKLPAAWQTGWKNLGVATVLAGLSTAVPRYGSKLFIGSMTRVLFDGAALLMEAVKPAPVPMPLPLPRPAGVSGMEGIENMLEQEYAS